MLDQGPAFYDRQPPRESCTVRCSVIVDGKEEPAILEDVSFHGCKLSCGRGIIVGSNVTVQLPGCVPVVALVKWSLGGRSGCVFRPRLDEDKLRVALEAANRLQDAG
jgi:hypothetical protein